MRNNLECDIFSEEMKMRELFGITCVGLGMLLLHVHVHGTIEYVWPFATVVWVLMRIFQVTDGLSNVNDILDERNSGIGQGRAKSYMAGFLAGMMEARPERAVGEGSTLIGDKLNTYYENRLAPFRPENEGYDCRNEFVIFLPIDPKITKIAHLKNQNLSVFSCLSDSVFECNIQLDDTGSIRKSVCWIFKRREDEDRFWASGGKNKSGDKIYFVGDIPSELPRDMKLAEGREEEKIGITRSFRKIIETVYKRNKVLLFDVGHSQTKQRLSEVMRQKFEVS